MDLKAASLVLYECIKPECDYWSHSKPYATRLCDALNTVAENAELKDRWRVVSSDDSPWCCVVLI